jgi:hypothetical protein
MGESPSVYRAYFVMPALVAGMKKEIVELVMAGLVPAIHDFATRKRRGCPQRVRA